MKLNVCTSKSLSTLSGLKKLLISPRTLSEFLECCQSAVLTELVKSALIAIDYWPDPEECPWIKAQS